jgi:two-component system chemotaxis response regulator CheB
VLAIGTSTGGPMALECVLKAIPASLPVPVVIVQHMPPLFTDFLAKRLSTECPLRVAEAKHGDVLEPGTALIAAGNFHMVVVRSPRPSVALNQDAPECSCRPSVDVLFRSVAAVYGARVLSVVMTGMGQDGLVGCTAIAKAGGQVIVQDETSSVVWGMPGAVARAGLAEVMLPVDGLAREIMSRIERSRRRPGIATH